MGNFIFLRQEDEAAGVERGLVEKPIFLEELKLPENYFFGTSDTKMISFLAQVCQFR